MTPAALLDVDGTLTDVSSVRHHVNPRDPRFTGRKRFDLFHGASHLCPPNTQALTLYERFRDEGLAILIVTARKQMWSMHTLLWLRDHGVEHERLYMRENNDNRVDVEVKRDILAQIRADGYDPKVAVDDNPSVCALWREHGITTHVIPGWT